jgi:hypothetical protein
MPVGRERYTRLQWVPTPTQRMHASPHQVARDPRARLACPGRQYGSEPSDVGPTSGRCVSSLWIEMFLRRLDSMLSLRSVGSRSRPTCPSGIIFVAARSGRASRSPLKFAGSSYNAASRTAIEWGSNARNPRFGCRSMFHVEKQTDEHSSAVAVASHQSDYISRRPSLAPSDWAILVPTV